MSERAHPDDTGFQEKWRISRIKGFIPWIRKHKNPYRQALFWRYNFVNTYCADMDVLDIPCGMGWGTSLLKKCRSLTGVDISEQAIGDAQLRYKDKASFQVGSMEKLDFQEGTFDLISCLEGIEHVPENVAQVFFSECSRVLRKHGKVIVSSPHCANGKHSGNPYHIKEYRPEELTLLMKPYFNILDTYCREVDNLTITMFVVEKKN